MTINRKAVMSTPKVTIEIPNAGGTIEAITHAMAIALEERLRIIQEAGELTPEVLDAMIARLPGLHRTLPERRESYHAAMAETGEPYDDDPTVCTAHMCFVPCRKDGKNGKHCVLSTAQSDVEAVSRYQRGESDAG